MKILAIGTHPDDLEINAYGTLAKCVKRGDEVTCASVCNGNLGHFQLLPDELSIIRFKEAKSAAEIIGADYVCLNCNDMRLDSRNPEIQRKTTDLIRRVRPDFIITNPPDDYMSDHVETSKLVFYSAFASSLPHYKTEHPDYEDIMPIYYYESAGGLGFIPDEYVDITDTYELKCKALKCHESQLIWLSEHDGADTLREIEITALYRGMQCKAKYAEGFKYSRLHLRSRAFRQLP